MNSIIRTTFRVLTFRATALELESLDRRHLYFGLFCTWLAGMGRYYDNQQAQLFQKLGVGSLIYIFILTFILWLIVKPLKPVSWTRERVLSFVSLTSPPAILYAIPVEMIFSIETSQSINAAFLAAVAAWRVALLFYFLSRLAKLRWWVALVSGLLPLTMIVTTLFALNLEHVVFNIMGGIRGVRTGREASYSILFLLTMFSFFSFIPLLLAYGFAIRWVRRSLSHSP